MKKKKWVVLLVLAAVVAGAAIIAAKGRDKKDIKDPAENTPFRLGKVQAEDLQVSVREVGVVDPVTKVDVKSAVSGRVIALKIREGAVVKSGDVLAEIEPDVNQAQSLSDVQASVKDSGPSATIRAGPRTRPGAPTTSYTSQCASRARRRR